MHELTVDPLYIITGLFAIIGAVLAYLFVRLDGNVLELQKQVVELETRLGKVDGVTASAVTDITILKGELSSIRDAILRIILWRRKLGKLMHRIKKNEHG